MYCVMWTYQAPPQLTREIIEKQFSQVVDRYLGIQGLIRKYFGFTEDGKSVIGIYLWISKEEADKFYTKEWMEGVTQRWGATPTKSEWIVPIVAESLEKKSVTNDTYKSL